MPRSSTYVAAVELAGLLGRGGHGDAAGAVVAPRQAPVGDLGADPGRGVERRDARAAGAQPLGQGALRGQLDLELAGEELALELLVLARRTTRSSAGCAAGPAAGPGPSRRPRSCCSPRRGRWCPRRAGRRSARWGCRTGRSRRRPGGRHRGCRPPRRRRWRRSCPRDPPAGSGVARHDIRPGGPPRRRSAAAEHQPVQMSWAAVVLGWFPPTPEPVLGALTRTRLDARHRSIAEGQVQAWPRSRVLAEDRARDGGLQRPGGLELLRRVPDGRLARRPSPGR